MSRYEFLPPGWSATYSLTIGWDEALGTFFAQVKDGSIGLDDNSVVIWLGGMRPHFTDLDAMLRTLNVRIGARLPTLTLTPEMRATLLKDQRRGSSATRQRDQQAGQSKPVFAHDLFPLGGKAEND